MLRWLNRDICRRPSPLNWLVFWACFAVFGGVLFQVVSANWHEHGKPAWVRSYDAWERKHTPHWFVHLFDRFF